MKFDAALKYQEIDAQVQEIERSIANSEQYKLAHTLNAQLNAATAEMNKLLSDAKSVIATYDELKNSSDRLAESINDLTSISAEEIDTLEALEYYERQIDAGIETLVALDRRCRKQQAIIDDLLKRKDEVMATGKDILPKKQEAEKAFYVYRNNFKSQIDSLKAELIKLSAGIDKQMLTLYNSLRKNGQFFWEYDVATKSCPRCKMNLSAETLSKLKNPGDWQECENCRRVLYIKD